MKRLYLAAGGVALATVVAIVVAVVAFSGGGGAGAGDTSVGTTDGTSESITVHGHWVIEVRDPDGSPVSRREFDNALTSVGEWWLMRLLARETSQGAWGVLLSSSAETHPCIQTGSPAPCFVRESAAGGGFTTWSGVTHFTTLTVGTDSPLRQVVLQGTATAEANGNIDVVESLSCYTVPPNLDPSTCNNGVPFTAQTLDTPVSVVNGQQILITLRISFS